MKIKLFRLALLALVAGWLAACSSRTTTPPLVLGTDAKLPPFASRSDTAEGGFAGFDIEIAKAIAAQAGRPLLIKELDFVDLLPALAADQVDFVVAAMSITPERRQAADFSEPYYNATPVVITLAGQPAPQTAEDLRDKRLAALPGSAGAALAGDLTSMENVLLMGALWDAVILLKNSGTDAIVLDEQPARALVQGDPEITLTQLDFPPDHYGVAVRAGRADLLTTVNAALAAAKADGRYTRWLNQWLLLRD